MCTRGLRGELVGAASDLHPKWAKGALTEWAETIDWHFPMYKPSKRAAATSRPMRVVGDQRLGRSRKRVYAMTKLKCLGIDPTRDPTEDFGADFGLTVGIKLQDNGKILRYDMVHMTWWIASKWYNFNFRRPFLTESLM